MKITYTEDGFVDTKSTDKLKKLSFDKISSMMNKSLRRCDNIRNSLKLLYGYGLLTEELKRNLKQRGDRSHKLWYCMAYILIARGEYTKYCKKK